ncbi:RAS protein activator like-3 [Rhinophrynus dorsalis]
MVEPCTEAEDTLAPDSSPPELSPLGSYQWKKDSLPKRSVWGRLQGWRQSRNTQANDVHGSKRKHLSLFRKSKGPTEPRTGGLARYMSSVSQLLGRRRETCQPAEDTEVSPQISAPPSTPEIPVWDVSNFSLIDGRLQLTKGDEQAAFHTRSRTGSCVSHPGVEPVNIGEALADSLLEGNLDSDTKNQFNNVKGLISKRKKKKNRKKTSISSLPQDERSLRGSRESVGGVEILDLANEKGVIIRALHSSILGERYCFEIITADSSRCFGCSSLQERDRWIENLRRIVQPDKDNCEREESSLSLWIHEAKGLPTSGLGSRSRYFCEVHLDGSLYGRTSSKAPNAGVVFWGESFSLRDLPSSQGHVALHLLQEGKEATGVGTVTLALEGMKDGVERWVPLGGEMALRVRGRYRRLCVLPVVQYKEFAEYLTWRYLELSRAMEPILSAREKEELGRSMVYVLQSTGKAKEFLVDLGVAEISRYDVQDSLIFRENTIVTKAIEEYMKMVGQTYLQETLGPFVTHLYASEDSHEVDPLRCSPEDLSENRGNLWRSCEEAVQGILQSQEYFPPELLAVFSAWQEEVSLRGRPDLGSRLVSASLFLRFLCPAILSPGLFHLSPEHPHPLAARALTLVAKVLQNLANFTRFGEKEEYMGFMNGFLEQYWDGMSIFLQTVSDPESEVSAARYESSADLGYELAALHAMLSGIFSGVHQQTKDQLEPLPTILKAIAEGQPVPASITEDPAFSTRQEDKDEPVFVTPRDLSKLRPLVNKSQSMNSLLRERLPPPLRGEEKEKKNRRHVTRTQSVPAQNRAKQERRGVSETTTVEEKEDGECETTVKRMPRQRPSSTLPRRKSTVPWCRNEGMPLLGQATAEVNSQEKHLQEMRGQIAENHGKQKDLEAQLNTLSGQVQEVLGQLAKAEETQRLIQEEMARKLSDILNRIDTLEVQKPPEKTQEDNLVEKIILLERRLTALEDKQKRGSENPIQPSEEEEGEKGTPQNVTPNTHPVNLDIREAA